MGIRYRVGQFWRILKAEPLSHSVVKEISLLLSHSELALFQRLAPHDQWHGYRVLKSLAEAGYNQPGLQAAALLHDVGKTVCPPTVWERSLVVMVQALMPGRARAWGHGQAAGWKRAFVVKAKHAEWGAQLAHEAGCSDMTVRLIRRHQDKPVQVGNSDEDEMLRHLQWADDLN